MKSTIIINNFAGEVLGFGDWPRRETRMFDDDSHHSSSRLFYIWQVIEDRIQTCPIAIGDWFWLKESAMSDCKPLQRRETKTAGFDYMEESVSWTLKVLRWSHQTLLTDRNVPDPTILLTKKLCSEITSIAGQSQIDSSSNSILHLAGARRWKYVQTCPNANHWFYSQKQLCLNANLYQVEKQQLQCSITCKNR